MVERSASCNKVQIVCNEDAEVVPTYDWTSFLQPHFQKITGIKKLHHFRYSASSPGTVFVKTQADAEESALDLLRADWQPSPSTLPQRIEPRDLISDERQWYLYERIRPFCSYEHRHCVPSLLCQTRNEGVLPHLRRIKQFFFLHYTLHFMFLSMYCSYP